MMQQLHSWVYAQRRLKHYLKSYNVHPNVHRSIIYNNQDMEAT